MIAPVFPLRPSAAVLAAALVLGHHALAGPPGALTALAESWRWRLFEREEGLGSGRVVALYQDREDYIYAAADDGVFRYDLHRWEAIEAPDAFDGTDVVRFVESMNVIYCVTSRALWVVQGGARLVRFYPRNETPGGRIYVAGGKLGEVYLIDEAKRAHLQIRGQNVDAVDSGVPLPSGRIRDYEVGQQRVHWLATDVGDLFYRVLGQARWVEVRPRDLELSLPRPRCAGFYCFKRRLEPVAKGSRGGREAPDVRELWALFQAREDATQRTLARLNGRVWVEVPSGIEGPPVEHVVMDQKGNTYATSEDGRLFFRAADAARDDGATWQRVDGLGLGQDKLHGGLLDSSGDLWFRLGAGGLALFDGRSRRWESLPGLPGRPYPKVLSLLESSRGEIWAGTSSGVFRYPAGFHEGEQAAPEFFDTMLGVSLKDITGLAEDSQGNVWISSVDDEAFDGAFYFGRDSGTWVLESFCDLPIRRIVTDRMNELWFLPNYASSLAADRERSIKVYRRSAYTGPEFHGVEVEEAVEDLVRTQGDVFWLATRRGLMECELEEDRFRVKNWYTQKEGLASPWLSAVAEGPGGAIWVCYHLAGGGVARIHDGEVTTSDLEEGLLSPAGLAILTAGRNLWFGTDRGLTRYDLECWYSLPVASASTRSWVYTLFAAGGTAEQNHLLVGTLAQGVLRFRMDDRRRPRFTARLFPTASSDGNVDFAWDARDWKNQTKPSELLFRNRLDGGNWSRFDHERRVSFSRLAPGRHSFEVEVRDLDGNRNREELVHQFTVGTVSTPFPWTAVVIALGTVCAVLCVVGLRDFLRARRERFQRYRGLFHAYPSPLFLLDAKGRVVEYNQVQAGLLGLQGVRRRDLIGRPFHLLPPFASPECRAVVQRALRGGESRLPDLVSSLGGGRQRVLEVNAFPLVDVSVAGMPAVEGENPPRVLGVAVGIHDRTRQLEEEELRLRDRRLQSLRDLADRFALEMQAVLRSLRDRSAGLSGESLSGDIDRVEGIACSLTEFASPPPGESSPEAEEVELQALLESQFGLDGNGAPNSLRHLVGARVEIDYRAQTGLWPVRAEPGPLRDALSHVFRNAGEAMPEKGRLTVRATNLRLEIASGVLVPGSYVELTVDDDGPGIDPQQLEAIFDPFYSTKPRDRARGLGLSLAYGIIRRQGGDIRVHSPPGGGTSVTILLPAVRR